MKGEKSMETETRIEVINFPKEKTNDSYGCGTYCPADCGCENAWNTCVIGD